MNGDITIRLIRPDEAERVYDLILGGMHEENVPLTIYNSGGFALYLQSLLSLPQPFREAWYFGAEMDGELIGMCEWRVHHDAVYWNNIYLDPKVRSAGLGRRLFATGIELARTFGIEQLLLDVFDSKSRPRVWYEEMGFVAYQEMIWLKGTNPADPQEGGMTVLNFPQAQSNQDAFGFSMLEIRTEQGTYSVGRLSDRYYRLNSVAAYRDEALLAGLKALDPERQLLVVCPEEEGLRLTDLSVACHSTKMRVDDPEAKAWKATL